MRLILISFLIMNSAFATCMFIKTECKTKNQFQNTYELLKVSCSAPGGPSRTTKTFIISNPNLDENIVKRKLSENRDVFFQVAIKNIDGKPYIKIDDRRILQYGEFHISTPNSDFMLLDGYKCKQSFN